MFPNIGFEMPGFTLQRDKFCVSNDVDVEMSSCLHQLWRDNAHGAVIRGEGFIELGHLSTYRRGTLQ
jgi:hypothetical protein